MDLAGSIPCGGLIDDTQPRQERSYHIIGDLFLPHPSACNLTKEHETLAFWLQKDLQMLHNRNLRALNRPLKSLDEAYNQFKLKELHSWRLAGQRPLPRDTLVRPSGSLDAPLAHHLHQPSYTTLFPQDDSETADPTNGCIAMLIGNLYTPQTLVFDHLHRRSEDSEGFKTLPEPVLNCHEDYTRDISESMSAKVELLHGRKILNRILNNAYKFTAFPLWGPFEGVTLFLAHESKYRNSDLKYRFRRICLSVPHPQRFFYEPKNSALAFLRDKIHIAASKMIGIPVREFYFRQKEWTKLILNPFRARAIKKLGSTLNALHLSESEADVQQMNNNKRQVKTTRPEIMKTCLQVEPTGSDLPVKVECTCIFCNNSTQPGPRQTFVDNNPRWTLHINRPLYVDRLRFCHTCNQKRRFVPIREEIHSIGRDHLLNFARTFQQFDSNIKAMLLDRLPPSSTHPGSAQKNPVSSAVSYEAQSSTTQRNSNKRTHFQGAVRDAERFKKQVNKVGEIIDSLCSVLDLGRLAHLNRQLLEKVLSVDVPDGLATIHDDTVYHDISAAAEVKRTKISSLAQANWVVRHIDRPETAPALPMTLDFELDMDRLKEMSMDNQRFVRKHQEDDNAAPVSVVLKRNVQTQISMASPAVALSSTPNPTIVLEEAGHRTALESRRERSGKVATFVSRDDSYLSASKGSDKRYKLKRKADDDLIQSRVKNNPAKNIPWIESTPQAEQQHYRRDLSLVKIDDMDCYTRHDRLRTLKMIIKRGDKMTEREKAQLVELEAKGTRAHNRDLSRMDVADMDTLTRKIRRAVLRKKIDRYEVLNEPEMKQLKDFGMLLYTKGGT